MENSLLDRVEAFVDRHSMLKPKARVIVACSGGPDSTCLLHLLSCGLKSLQLDCIAVYVDHGLRAETDRERDYVQELARRLGVGFRTQAIDVKGEIRRRGGSTQDTARTLRYEALQKIAQETGADCIAVGHTRSDQAETVLLQLLRGAGTRGLAGIAPIFSLSDVPIIRPLLVLGREEIEDYCERFELAPVTDPSNKDRRYMRNRLRHELLPLLKDFQPRLEERLAEAADILGVEDTYMEREASRLADQLLVPGRSASETSWSIQTDSLKTLDLALARRLVRIAVRRVAGTEKGLTFRHVEDVLALAKDDRGSAATTLPKGVHAKREYDLLTFESVAAVSAAEDHRADAGQVPFHGDPSTEVELAVPGATRFGDQWTFHVSIEAIESGDGMSGVKSSKEGRSRAVEGVMDVEALRLPLSVRVRRPGDRLNPLGMRGKKKLQDIFTDAKVPRSMRDKTPIVVDQDGIVWVVGHVLAERAKVTPFTNKIVRIRAVKHDPN